ncbi:carcinoembryonic antigen-related cell adhesion molecule 5 [Nothobranchius furzeri]|uniref:Carcinoembryonic antigen-related cell adhesion molecule 5 n=1 Tax=Nothobranchius furzeri TaxID=105023 RepID=A0A9D3BEY1_NOTFU|nr:carcinoembryonic antigen-related cell adhesion molecule 5 [Nothobranchius furzeri]
MLGPLTVISNRAALSIEKLPLAAQGLFTCQAFFDNEDGVRAFYYYVYLIVQVPVSKPYVLVSDEFPVEGSRVWMHCKVENGSEPIQYTWQHEALRGNVRNFTGNNSIINVDNINRSYSGWYHCVVSNAVNSKSSDSLLLNITFGPDVPQIDITPYRITKYGYSSLETETILFFCQAQSNPVSQYVWFYNDSQIYTGPWFTISNIFRNQTGNYSCLAENSYLNKRSRQTISLTVFYPPDGFPSCSVEAALNHTFLKLVCSWPGGFPSPSILWSGDLIQAGQRQTDTGQTSSAIMSLSSQSLSTNSSMFTCVGSHPALKQQTTCTTRSYVPPAEPVCFTNMTSDRQYVTFLCTWDGGAPRALTWWEEPGGQTQSGKEESNILVLRYGTVQGGKPYTCYAKHPLMVQPKTCKLTPEEGSTIWMRCNVEKGTGPIHYVWQREIFSGNFSTFTQGNSSVVSMTSVNRNHTSRYQCVADNAVNTESSEISWLNITFGPDVPQVDVAPYRRTEYGYSVLETENVSLSCDAQSNPASQYLWFYNNSQIYIGPQFTINRILRMFAGNYTCLAQNSYLNTRSKKTISLIIYCECDL